jgi:hypothetical protein
VSLEDILKESGLLAEKGGTGTYNLVTDLRPSAFEFNPEEVDTSF